MPDMELNKNIFQRILKTSMLSEFEGSRSNNFTFLRFVFAWAVLIGHSFPITGNGSDPISMLLLPHTWIGEMAVSGFFAISGYLVTASFMQRSMGTYIASRALRLYPAIIVYSLIAILIIGPLSSSAPTKAYFQSNPWNNMLNATLWKWIYNLPYAFSHNPLAGSTNGATWTLPAELRCYILIFILGFFGAFNTRATANICLLTLLTFTAVNYPFIPLFGTSPNYASPLTYFLLGSLFWINRSFVPLNWVLTAAAFISPFLGVWGQYFHYVYALCFIYIIFSVVYKAPHLDMDRFGDISYGVYIYSWPIQQMVWCPGQNAYINILLSTIIVFFIAYLSWHFVEKPALNIRKVFDSPLTLRRNVLASTERA